MERSAWRSLNGAWQFAFDFGRSGLDRHFERRDALDTTINSEIARESVLSGVHHTDFIPAVWYARAFTLSQEELAGRVLLHFGAVDYEAHVFVNGEPAGTHRGGYTSFCFDITDLCRAGENRLSVYAEDDNRSGKTAARQAVRKLRFAGLRLHAHHRHLADGVARICAGNLYSL